MLSLFDKKLNSILIRLSNGRSLNKLIWEHWARMKGTRIINKYPNRRLYDTVESRYITLSDIQQLVVEGEQFRVIDKTSGENITRSILLHVIAEQEEGGASVMSEKFLTGVIKSYDGDTQEMVRKHLEQNLSQLLDQ